ncbi:hypothetical protein SAMN06264364_12132 [Quadrisphaera granulorum]|uniref:Uncharacterized protein n=1 Tax=Quadrisphaera granulorum TaxID=317664 RepID=A0A316A0D7_9ACTN|nr:SHOCT domain-containing protein [Quadrisphaera granulorum]PWJ51155.1 hypothetical protein BXY45_12132 [Quadrisphaera granulorum]SZE97805.1 hypothetical protein SAMN06264364_12132 [Quadrisphaera granulorum]
MYALLSSVNVGVTNPGLPDQSFPDPGFPEPSAAGGFGTFMALIVVVFIGVVVFTIISAARNYAVMKRGGLDPMTAESQLAVDLHQKLNATPPPAAPPTAPAKSLEERLAELDDLAARGVISQQERTEARAKLLSAPSS